MRIISLDAQNVKRLKAVTITPDGAVVQITGKNGQGKSSVLDAIAYALGGKDGVCAKPVRNGQQKAKIVCKLDDLTVTRTFTAEGGGTLTVTTGEGAKYPSPQAVLDKMVGRLTLDPLAFARLKPKEQSETLKSLVGLDFTAVDQKRAEAYAERTAVNREHQAMRARADAMPLHADAPAEEVSVAELATVFRQRQEKLRANAAVRDRVDAAAREIDQCSAAMVAAKKEEDQAAANCAAAIEQADATLEEQIKRLRADHARTTATIQERAMAAAAACHRNWESAQSARQKAEALLARLMPQAAELVDEDPQEIAEQMAGAEVTNRKVRENRQRAELAAQADSLAAKSDSLSEVLRSIDEEKAGKLAAAAFPIPGLSFDESGVTYCSVPFSQASSAEQLRASVAIGLALNPKLRVLLIRDGSLLDSEGLASLSAMADEYDAQVWIERVEDSGSVGVVIEDGMVAAGGAQ